MTFERLEAEVVALDEKLEACTQQVTKALKCASSFATEARLRVDGATAEELFADLKRFNVIASQLKMFSLKLSILAQAFKETVSELE